MKLALRRLIKEPGFAAVVVLTLALGIGVNAAMFSLLHALLIQPLPYPDSDRLVRIFRTSPQSQSWPHSPANFLDHRTRNSVFASSAAYSWWSFNLSEPGWPAERVEGTVATGDYFSTVGTPPLLGRVFGPADDEPGQNHVAVISHRFWQRRFGGQTNALGRTLRLDGENVTIIGVMPSGFGHRLWGSSELWKPIGWTLEEGANRGNNWLNELARLKPGVSLSQAQAEMNGLAAQLAKEYPGNNLDCGLRLVTLLESATDPSVRRIAWFVSGLALLVLLITCANLANLQLARIMARSRELAVRAALGASRQALVRHCSMECLLLSVLGGGLGVLLAFGCNQILNRQPELFRPEAGFAVLLNFRVLLFALICTVLTVLLFGTLPAWLAIRISPTQVLRPAARGSSAGRPQQRLRHALIVSEIAFALVLLTGASLFVRGLERILRRDPGWQMDGVLTAQVALTSSAYESPLKRSTLVAQLEERLSALPGVRRAGISSMLPLWGFGSRDFGVEGQVLEPLPLTFYETVSPGFFETMGMRLLEGRLFDSGDTTNRPAVVIVNEAMVNRFWPGQSAIGKRLSSGDPADPRWEEVVGVVNNLQFPASFEKPDTTLQAYRPMGQMAQRWLNVMLRMEGSVNTVAAALPHVVAEFDSELPVAEIVTVRQRLDRHLANPTLLGRILVGFAGLGFVLSVLGIYGVTSYSVAQRTREFGIRVALGAQQRDLFWHVIKVGLRQSLLGTAIGLIGAWGVSHWLSAAVPTLPTHDPIVFATVTAALIVVTLLACYVPARRAIKVDPLEAL